MNADEMRERFEDSPSVARVRARRGIASVMVLGEHVALFTDADDWERARALGGGQWDRRQRCWLFPLGAVEAVADLCDALNGEVGGR